jgi:membrane protein implicated in regulation of membrane protease activity
MLFVGIAALLVGVVFLFVIPWVGIPVGIVGLLLLGVYLIGTGKRVSERRAARSAQ